MWYSYRKNPYKIVGKYGGNNPEEIDTADDKEEADYLLGDYKLAFSSDWQLWIEEENNSHRYYRHNAIIKRNDPCPCGSGKKYKKCCLHKPQAPVSPPTSSIDAYKRFVVAAILGQIGFSDSLIQQFKSEIYSVAAYVQHIDLQPIKRLYRGLLIEPYNVRGNRPTQPEQGGFASFTENKDVACWFALPESWIGETLAQGRPNVVGWIAEHTPQSTEIIFHYKQVKIVNDLPGPSLVNFARMLAQSLDPARTATEGPDWAMAQIGWNLNTQEEVILKKGIPLRIKRVETYGCPDVLSLDKRFRYRPTFIVAPPGLISVGVQPGERLNVIDVDYHDPYRICPQCRDHGVFLTYYLDRANLILMKCLVCHQNMFGLRP